MNKTLIEQMIKLSYLVAKIKASRRLMTSLTNDSKIFILKGDQNPLLKDFCDKHINDCLYNEQYLRLYVSNLCTCLDGFNPSTMEPIDYISSSDVRDKCVDICRGKKIVATINLVTGNIELVDPEQENSLEKINPQR